MGSTFMGGSMIKNFIIVLLVVFVVGCGQRDKEVKFQGVAEENNYVKQGMMYLQQKDVGQAIKNFDQAIKLDPKNPENYMTLGQVYLALKNYTRAIDTLTAATNVGPTEGKAHYLLAVCRKLRNEEGDIAKAIEASKRSIICFKKSEDKEGYVRSLGLLKSLMEGGDAEAPQIDMPEMQGLGIE